MNTYYDTRVLRTYIDAIMAPRIVAMKQSILSSTGLMTNMLDQTNSNAQYTLQQAENSKASADASESSRQAADKDLAMMQAMIYSINKVWLGTQAEDPTKDKNGDPLVPGVEYYNTTTNHVRVYRGDNAWHDQDETTEQEMSNAAASAANAAASAAAALASQNDVDNAKKYMDTYWLGTFTSPPSVDRNGNPLTPGSWYFDPNQHRTIYWNGAGWYAAATTDDVNEIHNDFVRVDGGNHMTGTLNILPTTIDPINHPYGLNATGQYTAQSNDWSCSPLLTSTLPGPVQAFSGLRTSYLQKDVGNGGYNAGKSYLDLVHNGPSGSPGGTLFIWSDGKVTTSGDIVAGNTTTGAAYFRGKALWAASADVAEMYRSKVDLPKGSIVSISTDEDPEQEIDLCVDRGFMFGVVSTSPGALLNSSIDGIPVALEGRVPMRVLGKVRKGQKIYLSDKAGVGTADLHLAISDKPIGFALQSIDNVFESTVEVALRF